MRHNPARREARHGVGGYVHAIGVEQFVDAVSKV